jgi:hypothetical protein
MPKINQTPLLAALSQYKGISYCYTGGRLCGKTTYATLLAIFLKLEEEIEIAVLDLSDDRELEIHAADIGIGVINGQEKDQGKLLAEFNKCQVIIIDLPIVDDLPLGFPMGKLNSSNLTSTPQMEQFCQHWYLGFIDCITQTLFSATDNDEKDYTYSALEHLQSSKVTNTKKRIQCFVSKSRTNTVNERGMELLLEEFKLPQRVDPLTCCDEYLVVIKRAKDLNPDGEPVEDFDWPAEYYDHYESILSLKNLIR